MAKASRTIVFDYVLEHAAVEPARKRVELYRALAEIAGDPVLTNDLNKLADSLEEADRRCREFTWRYQESQ
jgi:hypothetical protein